VHHLAFEPPPSKPVVLSEPSTEAIALIERLCALIVTRSPTADVSVLSGPLGYSWMADPADHPKVSGWLSSARSGEAALLRRRLRECAAEQDVIDRRCYLSLTGRLQSLLELMGTFPGQLDRPARTFADGEHAHRTALQCAALRGHRQCVEMLLRAGAAVQPRPNERVALHDAAEAGHVECCRLLLEHGAQLNGRDENGRTPLQVAAAPVQPLLGMARPCSRGCGIWRPDQGRAQHSCLVLSLLCAFLAASGTHHRPRLPRLSPELIQYIFSFLGFKIYFVDQEDVEGREPLDMFAE